VVAAGCAYQVVTGIATGRGSQSAYRAYEIGETDAIRVNTIDRLWVQATQDFAAFETDAGGLVRVMDEMLAFHSCGPALPEPDCEQLTADMREQACGACGGDGTMCAVARPGSRYSRTAERYNPLSCDRIDTIACRLAMDAPQECDEVGAWLIPADCLLGP